MSNKNGKRLTPAEALIMDAVWVLSEGTVREVQEHLAPVKTMAYNTVLTMMRILREKGFLEAERNGRVDVYRPAVTRQQAARWSVNELIDRFFAGSARALVSQVLDSGKLSPAEIKRIRQQVNTKLREKPS